MSRHRWDYGGTEPRFARWRTCTACGATGRTFGSGGWRTWSHVKADGTRTLGKIPPCEPAQATHTHGTDCTDPRTCRVPPEGHNPGTWDKPGCPCEVCEWIRVSS